MVTPALSRKEVKVFKNVSFDPRAIALWRETQGCFYRSEVLLFSHIYLHKKPLFGKKIYI